MPDLHAAQEFLLANTYCVLAVSDPEGKPHASMMHFAVGDVTHIYFATSPGSRKAAALEHGSMPASLVVGSGESWKTLQMDGTLEKITDAVKITEARGALYAKYPRDRYLEGPDTVFMCFTASWYRYADFTTEPPLVLPWKSQQTAKTAFNPE